MECGSNATALAHTTRRQAPQLRASQAMPDGRLLFRRCTHWAFCPVRKRFHDKIPFMFPE